MLCGTYQSRLVLQVQYCNIQKIKPELNIRVFTRKLSSNLITNITWKFPTRRHTAYKWDTIFASYPVFLTNMKHISNSPSTRRLYIQTLFLFNYAESITQPRIQRFQKSIWKWYLKILSGHLTPTSFKDSSKSCNPKLFPSISAPVHLARM